MRTKEYDIVFMDIQFPGMNGMKVTRMIRSEPEFSSKADIPVIAMTAYTMAGDKAKFLIAGMDDFIVKPVETPQRGNRNHLNLMVPVKMRGIHQGKLLRQPLSSVVNCTYLFVTDPIVCCTIRSKHQDVNW